MIRMNDKEEEVMNILWTLKKAFAKEILAKISPPVPPYNTVLSMIRKLEKDGFVDHITIGKSHQYFPKITKLAYQKSIMKHLMKGYFSSSPEKLLSFFMKEENLTEEDVQKILEKHKKNKKQ